MSARGEQGLNRGAEWGREQGSRVGEGTGTEGARCLQEGNRD